MGSSVSHFYVTLTNMSNDTLGSKTRLIIEDSTSGGLTAGFSTNAQVEPLLRRLGQDREALERFADHVDAVIAERVAATPAGCR